MSDIDQYLTDVLVDKVTDAIDVRRHEYRIDTDTQVPFWVPYCICGWSAEDPHDVAAYDRHLAVEALEAAAPLIAAQALRDAAGSAIPRGALAHETRAWLRDRADRIDHDALCPHPKCPGGGLCCCLPEQGDLT